VTRSTAEVKRTRAAVRRATLLAALVWLSGCGGGGESDAPGAGSAATETISVGAEQPAIAGTTLSVPAGAGVSAGSLSIGTQPASARAATPQAAVEAEPAVHMAVVKYALDTLDEGRVHPLYGPVLALGQAEFAGPGIELGPAGTRFSQPVTLTVPLSALGVTDPDGGLPLLRSEDGAWEVPATFSVDTAAGTASVDVTHFSLLQWLRNAFVAPQQTAAIYATGAVEATLARLRQDNLQRFAQATYCSGAAPATDLDGIPPLPDLLDYLGFERGAVRSGQEDALKGWIQARHTEARAGREQFNSITLERLYEHALELNGGDVFKALVTAHNTLRDNRNLGSVQDMIENYRGDGGDERGARYHFFGMALYSYAYEHFQAKAERLGYAGAQLVIGTTMKPETVATIEEGIVSGDLVSDITEYGVDLQGAKLGRELFSQIEGRTPEALASAFGLDPEQCGSIRFTSVFTGLNFDGSVVQSPQDADIQLSGDPEQPSIAWTGPPATALTVLDLTDVTGPGVPPVQLFCIRSREDPVSGADIPFAPPVAYGTASTAAFEPCDGTPAFAAPLRSGRTYQVGVGSEQASATIVFVME